MSSYAVPPVGSGFIGHGSPAVSEYNYGTGQYVDRLPAIFGQQNYGELDSIPYLDELQAQQNLGDSHRWWHKAQQFVEDIPQGIQQIVDDAKEIGAATSACTDAMSQLSEASGLESIPQYTALYNECVKAYNESKETYDRWDRETRDFLAEEQTKQSSKSQSRSGRGGVRTRPSQTARPPKDRFGGRSTQSSGGALPTFARTPQMNKVAIALALGGLAFFAYTRSKK